jgi:hypothetical protein
LSPAPQGTDSDWKNLPGTTQFLSTQIDTAMFALRYKKLHREHAVTGKIFQALPTQTDTIVALIYKMAFVIMTIELTNGKNNVSILTI